MYLWRVEHTAVKLSGLKVGCGKVQIGWSRASQPTSQPSCWVGEWLGERVVLG